jgi:pantoate--beta-alanine ligase
MEGAHRPGHFRGVIQVVHRLFEIVQPDVAYFGEKDFQQLAVIRAMVAQLGLPVRIVGCPTCRETDGLAMSSRNMRLTAEERTEAPVIHRALRHIRDHHDSRPLHELKEEAIRMIESTGKISVEYLEIADADTLLSVEDISRSSHIRSFVAAHLGSVRLIDNEVVAQR